MRLHVPQDANIVLVDFAVNDLPRFSPAFNNPDRWVAPTSLLAGGDSIRGGEEGSSIAQQMLVECVAGEWLLGESRVVLMASGGLASCLLSGDCMPGGVIVLSGSWEFGCWMAVQGRRLPS